MNDSKVKKTGITPDVWNKRFMERIIDSMADGVFTMDTQGRITSWNRSMERISGFSTDEAVGKTCEIIKCSRCFGKACPSGTKACGILEHGRTEVKDCSLQHKDGHDIPVIKNASVVRDDNDKIIGAVETVTDLTELTKARLKAAEAQRRLGEVHRLGNIIGKSNEMHHVYAAIKSAAASDATVFIQGESGTGKELVAASIHHNSERADFPMVTVNCSALPENLLESELFGHARGSFTGAIRDRMGRFEEAGGGTIFLDEIGELSPFIQVKLLRVLQEREIERVGESRKRKINIRVITATHQDLYGLVRQGNFRDDLYYRLKVFPIYIPPLRQRKNDIPLLADHFIKTQVKKTGKQIHNLSQAALRLLMDNDWPGNVRELQNAIEHAFVLCDKEWIEVSDLPVEIRRMGPFADQSIIPEIGKRKPSHRRKISKDVLVELLNECDWNKTEVGRRIGLSRTAIWKYMKKWNIPLKNPSQ